MGLPVQSTAILMLNPLPVLKFIANEVFRRVLVI